MNRDIDNYFSINEKERTMYVTLYYPRSENEPNKVNIGLLDIRAADDLLIEYDFKRDGYSIKQASVFEWDENDGRCDPDWQEVAFIKAWARENKND